MVSAAVILMSVVHPAYSLAAQARVTASSEWGPGYGADRAADGAAGENGNYWQTVQGKDKAAWWRQDLGRLARVQGFAIHWARYEDKVHCPPARALVQLSPSGAEGSWVDARTITANELPRDGDAYPAQPASRYMLANPVQARFVRLLFPDGGQPGTRYPGYLCVGEVEVLAPELAPRIVSIKGRFGRADVDLNRPAMVRLHLRGPSGLGAQSLLARRGAKPWAQGAHTYVIGPDGVRYESRACAAEKSDVESQVERQTLRIHGIKLSNTDGEAVAIEDWTLTAPGDGSQLVWQITRRWQRDFTAVCAGSPGLFFGFNARQSSNSVTSTIWYDPSRLEAKPSDLYRLQRLPGRVSENHVTTVRDRDTWAIYKLWTNWHEPSDLRLDVQGGHLYRRGSFALLSEAGAVTSAAATVNYRRGQIEKVTLTLSPSDKYATGYQLAVRLPDKETETSLRDFYGSVLNGGAVNDQKNYDFGNETDGWYYAGSCWMYGMALAAGVPASGALSAHPYDAAGAFREHLAHVFATLDDKGQAHFGYNQGGEWVDDNLHTILGTRAYLMHSGDLAFVRRHLGAMERMLSYFIRRRDAQGLFKLDSVGAHWYYDAITTSGTNGYYNAFFYKAACDLAEMEAAAGQTDKASEYHRLAQEIRTAFNHVLWRDHLPGGPRYLDWIDAKGDEVAYFCDLCQWPPIAVGIATPEQARKIVATADARIRELEKEHGYQGFAGLSALWPVPASLNPHKWQTFGRYMNGGSLLCQTYWEVVARARAGDAEGAAHRLKRFARRAGETFWAGDNAANIRGEMANGDGEPYLADMVVTTASVIHGILGVMPTWDRLEVAPRLPSDWPWAEADILYKGQRHRIRVDGERVEVSRQ